MKQKFKHLLWGSAFALCSAAASAQGLEGVIVENFHTTTQADADYYNGLGNGSGTMTAGLTTYRVYIDMATGYKLNTVFGTAGNVLDVSSTSVFWNDDGFGSQFPPQTSRLDDGAAFDSWISMGRASKNLGAAGCTGNLEQLAVLRAADTNGNLTMCNLWSGFGPTDNDGSIPGTSADLTLVGITATNLVPFTDVDGGNAFTTTGSWGLLPALNGPEANGNNRVLIGQFTTAGTFSFHLNVSLAAPGGGVEFYTHTSTESGSTVSAFLTYPVACTPVQISGTSSNSPICSNETLNLGVTTTGTGPFTYTWTGTGTITNGNTNNASVTGAATGNYNIAVSNACGNVNQNVAVVVNTATNWYADTDGDGFGAGAATLACTQPIGSVANNTDLCPTDANKQAPGACGCGVADVAATYYADTDGDGFGAGAAIPGFTCNQPAGTVTNNTDLCPTDANKQAPGACGCGVADVAATYYADTDGDGFGAGAAIPGFTCNQPAGTVTNNTDLCPTDANKQAPGACGCGVADVAATYYADTDGDGFGAGAAIPGFTCNQPAGTVTNNTDNCPNIVGVIGSSCDDGNANTSGDQINASCQCVGSSIPCPDDGNPCTGEVVVNGVCTHPALPDTDGDGTCDLTDGCPNDPNKIAAGACGCGVADVAATYYADTDGDGFGAGTAIPGFTCNQPAGTVTNNTDLCPTDANKQAPGACGCGVADVAATYYADTDGDGFGAGAAIPGFTCNQPAGTVTNNTDNCPNIVGVIGSTCDDGNANTTGDVITAGCQCVGSTTPCPDDGNPCTSEVVVNGVCTHPALPDTDGDGTCDLTDGCPNDPNKIAAGACGCGVADVAATYYADTDGDGFGAGTAIPGFTCNQPAGTVTNNTDNCPNIVGVIGSVCNDNNANTENDVITANCQCAGTTIGGGCQANAVFLEIQGDGVSLVNYEIRIQGSNAVAANGGQVYPTGNTTVTACLPNGCYYLVVTDNGGDGITGGGYVLRSTNNRRLIDDRSNFTSGGTSAIANNEGFCLPMGTDHFVTGSCDKYDWTISDYVVADANPAVSAQYGVSNATSGYQIWFYNPNGGYSFMRFQSHNTANGLNASATRACNFKVNNWVGNQLQQGVLYNVRVRGRVNGVNNEFGPACRFVFDATRALCPLTKLMDIPGNQYFSCNSTRNYGGGNYIAARPVSRLTAGGATQSANRYQFRFRTTNGTLVTTRTSTTYLLQLNWAVSPLLMGNTYNVDVRASFDNGTTWCSDFIQPSLDPWGEVCTLTINGNSGSLNMAMDETNTMEQTLRMYPNPNRGDQLFIGLEHIADGVNTVSVDLFDVFGKRVSARTIAVQDGFINTVLELNGELAAGMYTMSVTAGEAVFTERLVIQP